MIISFINACFLTLGHQESPGVVEAESGEDQETSQCSVVMLHQLQV